MTNQQSAPEALRLADELAQRWGENMVCSELEAAAELRRLHYENAWLAALVEAQQAAPSAADRVKLPEPDTAETAPWTGWKVKYHSPDQIIGYGNQQFNAGRQFEAERLAALRAQQPTTHVQNPAEIEHVAGDVSKNGPGSNMAQPAPSAAAAVGEVEPVFWMNEKGHTWSHSDWKQFPKHRAKYPIPLYAHRPASQPSPTPQADSAPAEAVQRIVHLRTDRERRVYVAGPMTGLPEYNFPLFNATAARLRSEGWHVENPAEHGHVEGAGWADYLRWDISRIATCGAIYLLPGWSKSKGATLEVHIASVLGLQVLLADGAESPTAQPAPAATPTAASLAWNALRDLTGPLGEDGVKIMGHIRTYAQRQYEAGLAEGRAAPAATPQADSQPAPIDMVLHCPACGMQHIDASEPPVEFEPGAAQWNNPPHRSHLCHGCGHIWRPADVPTNGVKAVKTTGKADSPIAARAQADSQPAPEPADIIAGALQTSRGHAMELMQQAVDADRAARAPADSVTTPAGGAVAEVVMAIRPPKASPAWLPHKIIHASLQWLDSVPVGTKLYTTPPAQAADSVTAPAYSIDADPQGIRARVAEAITGALAFGAQGANPPPTGHWLAPFWEMAREEASCNRPVSSDTLYLLRRLLSNQHTLTGSEFREELTKIVGEATQAADSVPVAPFDDPKVQAVYAILCSDVQPPEGEHWEGFAARRIVDAISADSVLEDADPIRALIAEHAAILDQNESAYFELCYHRATGWMAWITDKPLCMPPVVNPDRKVLAQGQGDTADEACRDAARKQGGA